MKRPQSFLEKVLCIPELAPSSIQLKHRISGPRDSIFNWSPRDKSFKV